MLIQKPTLTLRKDDETAFVNARSQWVLTGCTAPGNMLMSAGRCYELRIRHAAEDTPRFFECDAAAGDDRELVSLLKFESLAEQTYQHTRTT